MGSRTPNLAIETTRCVAGSDLVDTYGRKEDYSEGPEGLTYREESWCVRYEYLVRCIILTHGRLAFLWNAFGGNTHSWRFYSVAITKQFPLLGLDTNGWEPAKVHSRIFVRTA